MNRIWIKLYLEILDDPKMGRLPNHLWRRAIELFLLAGKNGNDGLLQPVEEMAWVLRSSEDEVRKTLMSLAEVGVVHESPEGWVVSHFKDRQYSESYERVKRYRNAKSNADGNADETENTSSSTSNSSSVSNSSEGGVVGEGEVFKAFQENIGVLTPFIADAIKQDIDDYTAEWVLTAIDRAAKNEKRSLSYVEGTLKGWKRDGLVNPRAQNGNGKHAEKIPADAKERNQKLAERLLHGNR